VPVSNARKLLYQSGEITDNKGRGIVRRVVVCCSKEVENTTVSSEAGNL
jgi:hypothetical protein